MFCPKCGTKNIENARFCIQCGHSYNHKQKRNRWWLTGIILTFFLLSGGFIYYIVLDNEHPRETAVEETIQTQVERNSNLINWKNNQKLKKT
ncbi:zinc-ribbon domain-containing protein [Guptibacillus hwajinpoensis]|uniref:zinc-ribbon domain-containing protein n=1 Tax=Guptibacillus hwajinpoensis TaxID=208199 RepID=UPI003D6A60C9